MSPITLSEILDDLRAAETGLHKFERRYWLGSVHSYELYSQGLLDGGSHAEDFAEWAGRYKVKHKREAALDQFSRQRVEQLRRHADGELIELAPQEPVLDLP